VSKQSTARLTGHSDIVSRYALLRVSTQKSERRDIHICLASSRIMLQVDVFETVDEPKNRVRRSWIAVLPKGADGRIELRICIDLEKLNQPIRRDIFCYYIHSEAYAPKSINIKIVPSR